MDIWGGCLPVLVMLAAVGITSFILGFIGATTVVTALQMLGAH